MAEASGVESISAVFKCVICMERLVDARMCPNCSKLCCYGCIRRWLTERRPQQCPHCRSPLHLQQLVNCRWAEEITQQLESLSFGLPNAAGVAARELEQRDRCAQHKEKLSVYCWPCQISICHACALWGGTHSGHTLKPLDEVYESTYNHVKEEIKKLRKRQVSLISTMQELERNVDLMRESKEEKVREIRLAVELMITRLDSQLKSKLVTILMQKNSVSQDTEVIESLIREVEGQLEICTKAEMIRKSAEFLQLFNQLQVKTAPEANVSIILPEFQSEIVPPYDGQTFVLSRFSQLRAQADPIYSQPLILNGSTWRLKVYPDGNGVVRGNYLSVFLELSETCHSEPAKFEYRVEMMHQSTRDSARNIIREFASDFEVGECWGYNRFFKLDYLAAEGFLDVEADALVLRFLVRPPTYHQKCKELGWYIEHLETNQDHQMTKIIDLQRQLCDAQLCNSQNHVPLAERPFSINPTLLGPPRNKSVTRSTPVAGDAELLIESELTRNCVASGVSPTTPIQVKTAGEKDVDEETMTADNDIDQQAELLQQSSSQSQVGSPTAGVSKLFNARCLVKKSRRRGFASVGTTDRQHLTPVNFTNADTTTTLDQIQRAFRVSSVSDSSVSHLRETTIGANLRPVATGGRFHQRRSDSMPETSGVEIDSTPLAPLSHWGKPENNCRSASVEPDADGISGQLELNGPEDSEQL